MIKDVAKWLKTAPRKSEIVEIQNGKDKVKIIPQKIIESLLDELTEQNWSTRNFQFSRSEEVSKLRSATGEPADKLFVSRTVCDASLELVVTYRVLYAVSPYDITLGNTCTVKEKEITRVLVGAVSFDVSLFGNDHIANTAKSLAISNAASDLGRRFGKDLNPKEASMMILGMKAPVQIPGQVTDKNKITESLEKIKNTLTKKPGQ